MANVSKVSVALTGEQLSAMKAAVDRGEYATTSEIVREALRDWQLKRQLQQDEVDHLRRLWDAGVASGSAGKVDFAEVRAAVRAKLKGSKPS
ncbi:hypothetical protein GJW-30_1_03482 [Variibacter gotjawalensis]|uniref:Antitoxin ParD4 n=1 Tax=Variibacter gotjawalensis TaxID=1333996 RepID=A0A0S3PYH5_9BRAD|nr:type II toxin-antitoxin system ParD family antitoxin [Variibacter gotjawalensis]RZS48672.1 antitoxin ParD1/3/4 [Variibacter gotjawalensis]BAT60932.1 hypothetical protein GJW-30_1_03482 [Variibacter gotjawalensis]